MKSPNYLYELKFLGNTQTRLLEVLECVISLETFPFVERHYTELGNVPSLALFHVNCANMALPRRIRSLATFTLHTIPEGMFWHITLKSPRGIHMRPTWGVS
jgi:hypothetical protein